LINILLDFLLDNSIFEKQDILQAKLNVLSKTGLIDLQIESYKAVSKDIPSDLETKRNKNNEDIKSYDEISKPLRSWDDQSDSKISKDEQLDALFKLGKLQYENGNYTAASESLYAYLSSGDKENNKEHYFSASWGKLGSDILSKNWDQAVNSINSLKDLIDSSKFGKPLEQLQQRSWLIHWSLFVYFNSTNEIQSFVDLCMEPNYLNAIQTTSPHILRYLSVAIIMNKNRKSSDIDDLLLYLQSGIYSDSITQFICCLLDQFDFDSAKEKLTSCKEIFLNDYFLYQKYDEFMEYARMFILQLYSRINQSINIQHLEDKLGINDKEQTNTCLTNAIEQSKIDASVDTNCGKVIIETKYPSVYEKIITKTATLESQTNNLSKQLE